MPDFALEVVSESSGERDRARKKSIYESLGVAEYFVFDPDRGLQGFRLAQGRYRPIRWTATEPGRDGLYSEALGLFLFPGGPENELERHDPATGEILRSYRQAEAEIARVRARNDELLALVRELQGRSEQPARRPCGAWAGLRTNRERSCSSPADGFLREAGARRRLVALAALA